MVRIVTVLLAILILFGLTTTFLSIGYAQEEDVEEEEDVDVEEEEEDVDVEEEEEDVDVDENILDPQGTIASFADNDIGDLPYEDDYPTSTPTPDSAPCFPDPDGVTSCPLPQVSPKANLPGGIQQGSISSLKPVIPTLTPPEIPAPTPTFGIVPTPTPGASPALTPGPTAALAPTLTPTATPVPTSQAFIGGLGNTVCNLFPSLPSCQTNVPGSSWLCSFFPNLPQCRTPTPPPTRVIDVIPTFLPTLIIQPEPTTPTPTQPTTPTPTTPPPATPPPATPPPAGAPIPISDTEKISIDVGGEKIPFQYIVVLEDLAAVSASTLEDTFQALNTIVEGLGAEIIYTYNSTIAGFAFKAPNQLVVDQIVGVLELDPRVKFVEQDQTVVPFETISTGIDRIDADPLFTNSRIGNLSADVDIAIIDSGIDLDHPDLNIYKKATSIIPQDSSLPSSSSHSDSLINNEIDLEKIDLNLNENPTATFHPPFSKDAISTADDKCGHGTHVAGVAAAKYNSFGVLGIAPGARLWAIKVLEFNESTGKCEAAISSIIEAVDYVTKNAKEIDVANLSLGCKCNSLALKEAIDKSVARNVIYVVAAGNIHADASSFSPANHDGVISVSAIADNDGKCGSAGIPLWIDAGNMSGYTTDDSFASFSNYGPTIDIAAPGVGINSTYLDGSYAEMGGTSIAAPHVAGAAALYKLSDQNASATDVRTILADSGSNKSTVCNGSGRGYFTQDADPNPEPLLYLFDAISTIGTPMSNETATFLQQDAPEQTPTAQSKSQSQPLLQQESVTETNTDVAAMTASTTRPTTTNSFLTYENSTYGVKISYPANWTYYGTAENSGFIDIVIFEAPFEGRTDSSSALFMVSRDTLPSDRSTSLKEYAYSIINQYKQSIPDFNLIESSTDSSTKLLNRPAYRIVSTNVQDDITYKALEMGTIIGNRVYLITYDAEEAEFSKYQSIGQDMINSFRVVGLFE